MTAIVFLLKPKRLLQEPAAVIGEAFPSVDRNKLQVGQEINTELDLIVCQRLILRVGIGIEREFHSVALVQGDDADEIRIAAHFSRDQELCAFAGFGFSFGVFFSSIRA